MQNAQKEKSSVPFQSNRTIAFLCSVTDKFGLSLIR